MLIKKIKKAAALLVSSALTAGAIAVPSAVTEIAAAADSNYMEALAMSLYFYDSNACGSGITDGPLTWRGDCHTYDAEASVGSLDGSLKSVVDPDGDGKVDVSGGFHDAGDHIKFNLTIGFGISSLAMSEYLNPGVYEKAGCKDHLIYELKWGADYLMKTTFLNGSGDVAAIAHVVANGGEDHSHWTAPEVQTYKRDVYWLTASRNNSAVCGEMAAGLAGTAYVLKDSDPAYAAECITYAKALIDFGTKHTGNEDGGISGFYSTDSQYQDEIALAQAWLYILGEGSKPSYTTNGGGAYNGNLYDGYLYCWDKVWQGYAALMYSATGDSSFKQELIYELGSKLSETSYNADGWGASRYNCARQMVALVLAGGDKNSSYAKQAKFQMDYILGNNSYGYSFLLGYGDNWPTHIHHRAANPGNGGQTSADNPAAKYTNYGMLVGGPDGSGYQDHSDRYQYTEGALDYNGCFALACAGLANIYGGDTTAITAVANSASEINSSFSFGGSTEPKVTTTADPSIPTTTSTTTTRVTTTTTTVVTEKRAVSVITSGTKTELQVNIKDADAIEYIVKATPGVDINGAIDYTDKSGKYSQFGSFSSKVDGSGSYTTIESLKNVEAQNDTLTIHVWWSQDSSAVIDQVNLIYYDVVSTPETTDPPTPGTLLYGDANCDENVTIADATAILQHLGNQDKYGLTAKGALQGDVYKNGDGISVADANVIQQVDCGLYKETDLPIS